MTLEQWARGYLEDAALENNADLSEEAVSQWIEDESAALADELADLVTAYMSHTVSPIPRAETEVSSLQTDCDAWLRSQLSSDN